MTNMSIQPLWLTHFIEFLLVLEFQLTKFIVAAFSYKAHFRPQISSNDRFAGKLNRLCVKCIASFGSFMAWSCSSCHCWFVCRWMQRSSRVCTRCTCQFGISSPWPWQACKQDYFPPLIMELLSWKPLLGLGFNGTLYTLPSGLRM